MRFFPLILLFVAACSNAPYRGIGMGSVEDFVIESYQVQEGKLGILAVEGCCMNCLDESYLEEYQDTIQDGDVLCLVLHHPVRSDCSHALEKVGQSIGYEVTDGAILLPDVGRVEIGGLSIAKAQEKIAKSYGIEGAEVFVSYQERKKQRVELLGLVGLDSIAVDGKLRLFDTLSQARIPPSANLFKSYVVRDDCLLPVDLYRLVKEGDMCQNIVMRGQDKIYIADSCASSLMVLGEVNCQRVVDLPNGFMSLREALAQAGGITLCADRRYIQIIRGNMLDPRIYTLNWEHVVQLPTNSLLLIPGDIVFVAATPISQWDRFVNQILPTLIGFDPITLLALIVDELLN